MFAVISFVTNGVACIDYTVNKSEGINAIAARYGITNSALMQANGLKENAVLQQGQILKIPLANIIKPSCKGINCMPVYYEVQQSEGLYRIGKNHGDIKAAQLKQLNNLTTESVSKGKQLLVGYLSVNANNQTKNTADTITNKIVSANADTIYKRKNGDSKTEEAISSFKEESKSAEITNSSSKLLGKKNTDDSLPFTYKGAGFFESQFKAGSNQSTLLAAPFKSESGFNDGKFYALTDAVATGTIIKINNPAVSVFVYAKVIGPLPRVKE